jgi:hypothetical protein
MQHRTLPRLAATRHQGDKLGRMAMTVNQCHRHHSCTHRRPRAPISLPPTRRMVRRKRVAAIDLQPLINMMVLPFHLLDHPLSSQAHRPLRLHPLLSQRYGCRRRDNPDKLQMTLASMKDEVRSKLLQRPAHLTTSIQNRQPQLPAIDEKDQPRQRIPNPEQAQENMHSGHTSLVKLDPNARKPRLPLQYL